MAAKPGSGRELVGGVRGRVIAEVVIGRGAAAWLRALGFEVWQEVQIGQGGSVIDLVGTLGPFLVTIECKTTFSLDVIEQAEHWRRSAHFTWCAVPRGKSSHGRRFAERVCRAFGVGVLYVDPSPSLHERTVVEQVHPEYFRHAPTAEIRRYLLEGQKTRHPAGSQGAGRWTPFRATCEGIQAVVRAEPGIPLRDAIDKAGHHYASVSVARVCLTRWIEAKKIPGVVLRRDGRVSRLYLEG